MKRFCAFCEKSMGYVKGGKRGDVTHGICRDCLKRWFPKATRKVLRSGAKSVPGELTPELFIEVSFYRVVMAHLRKVCAAGK